MCEEANPRGSFAANEMTDKTSEHIKVQKRKGKWAGRRLSELSIAGHK